MIDWKINQIWKGSILTSIAHAIMVAHYPELSNEHSWDGINYIVQDNAGARGTITFRGKYCTAAFRYDLSERVNSTRYGEFFKGAPRELIEMAESETLQYLLDEVEGEAIPVITTAFWGEDDELFSIDSFEELLENGGHLLKVQSMDYDSALSALIEYYDMSQIQLDLLQSIYARKIKKPEKTIVLSKKEIDMIGVGDISELSESTESFKEINIIRDIDG